MNESDLIYRRDAINTVEERIQTLLKDEVFKRKCGDRDLYGVKRLLQNLPSAQQWIQCEERMPDPSEDGKNFLVTVSEICSYNNGIDYYQKEERWVTIEQFFFVHGDAHFFRAWYDKSKIIAWMPLPQPWKEVEDERIC